MGILKKNNPQSLIKKCIKGNAKAQKELYDNYSPKMFGICLRYARDYQNAEDLLQEGFIKVFRYLKDFRGTGSFEGWMRRIFVNVSIEQYRKASYLYPVGDYIEYETRAVYNTALDELSVQDIMGFVNELADGYKVVFNLYAIEGYTHKEIGEMLNISEGTSKSQLARARGILQKKVTKYYIKPYEAIVK
jgi:RNA polymerase sigma factor (sigma-70 family)